LEIRRKRMNNGIIQGLINNTALLLALFAVYEFRYMISQKYNKYIPYIDGFLTGIICIAIMTVPFRLADGIFFDTRTILVSVTVLIFGSIPGVICASMAIFYRVFVVGGGGALTGSLTVFFAALTGLLWRRFVYKKKGVLEIFPTYIFGVIVNVLMILMMFFMPKDMIRTVFETITLPVLVIYPIVTVLLSKLLLRQKQRNEAILREAKALKALSDVEAQLRQQQKLEAIGTLAGGVAHEINNPLNGIMNYAQLVADISESESNQSIYANNIIKETERISGIVKDLLQFSRQEKQSHSYADFYDIVNRTVSLVNTIIKKDQIDLEIKLDDDLPQIKCRSQQIQQVLMNLLTNSRDSLNEKYPGYDENKKMKIICNQYESKGRRWIKLVVEDNGIGIPDDIQDKIFTPFFSTKPKDKGTGLGLSISFGIVRDHHGEIEIDSVEGEYTKIIVTLPVDNGWEVK